jgi:hypothetical protein
VQRTAHRKARIMVAAKLPFVAVGLGSSLAVPTIPSPSARIAFPVTNCEQKADHCGNESPPHWFSARHEQPDAKGEN